MDSASHDGRRIRGRGISEGPAPLDTWIGVTDLARDERVTRRQVYAQIDRGMPHSRVGDVIRVRRGDWRAWHERHLRGSVECTMDAGAPRGGR